MMYSHNTSNKTGNKSWLFSRAGFVTVGAVSILGFLVYTGHSAHLLGFAPYALLLACPLMHMFMHGGHGHGAADSENTPRKGSSQIHNAHKGADDGPG